MVAKRVLAAAHDDDDGPFPQGHFVFRTSTYRNWVMARAFVGDTGEGESALRWYREGFRVYPLAAGRPDPDAAYRMIVEAHRGTVEITSGLRGGTRIIVTLPA